MVNLKKSEKTEPVVDTTDLTTATDQMPDGQESEPTAKVARYRELYSQKYPDANFETDGEYEDAFYQDYSKDQETLKSTIEDNEKIFEIMSDNPELGAIIGELAKGTPFVVALAKYVDLEDIIPQDGEPDYTAYQEASQQRRARKKELEDSSQEFRTNQEATQQEAVAFFEELGLSEEDSNGLVDFVDGLINDIAHGKLNKVTLNKLYQAYKYDESVASAAQAGRVAGRNEKIETARAERSNNDGLPADRGAAVEAAPEKPRKMVIDFDKIKGRQ